MDENKNKKLSFGTGGMRGIMGEGEGYINEDVIKKLTHAVASWVLEGNSCEAKNHIFSPQGRNKKKAVAIGYDSRNNSRKFAFLSSEILASRGINVYVYDELMPTPALSFAVRNCNCCAGIMVTASHNRAEYNGYKVYDCTGAQITEKSASRIEKLMQENEDIKVFEEGSENRGEIIKLGEEMLEKFTSAILENRTLAKADNENSALSDISIVYTPLNGAGLVPVTRVLEAAKIGAIYYVEEQKMPDGNFPTCEYPNPEKPEALKLGIEKLIKLAKNGNGAKSKKIASDACNKSPDALLATDPDSDRLGVVVLDKAGEPRQLTGNEVGILFLNYLIETKLNNTGCTVGENCVRSLKGSAILTSLPIVFTTIVSSSMITPLCEQNGIELKRTLTGFKYIGEGMTRLEEKGELDRFLFGYEESIGYLAGTHSRDKDAVGASLLFCEMLAYYKKQGETVLDVLSEIYEKYGYFADKTLDFTFEGEAGARKIKEIMSKARELKVDTLARTLEVIEKKDYLGDETGLPKSDVLELYVGDFFGPVGKIIVRPSGTEPKIKFYILVKGIDANDRDEKIKDLKKWLQERLL